MGISCGNGVLGPPAVAPDRPLSANAIPPLTPVRIGQPGQRKQTAYQTAALGRRLRKYSALLCVAPPIERGGIVQYAHISGADMICLSAPFSRQRRRIVARRADYPALCTMMMRGSAENH
ncbi:hypothetical protein BIY26_21235 [Brenneria goodwinii]|uniref:Uncharacterized protein n=1 Tax=Brenneria goodwinii TaxID=1109412 RepID=A0AAE8EKL5_9GAMM|nr:hypothetical protein AWC36_14495 [Brenneria goodwinii]RLM17188.1 hypothetical protein BIY26_21235 [Brenneria goodwinii]